jgi:ABC-type multidrug transport system ATPase subunit
VEPKAVSRFNHSPVNVELSAVDKTYGRIRALDGVSLSLAPGQIIAILGSNGAGKTTLLRCLAGLIRPDQGEVTYDGRPFAVGDLELRRRMMFLPDFPPHFSSETVLRSLGLVLRIYGADGPEAPERVLHWLRAFDLLHLAEAPVESLSRGQSYKVALLTLLVIDPELWLLDEPLASGMDPRGLSLFKSEARAAAARGRTILYTTQVLEAAERFADRVCILHQGEVRVFETVANLRHRVGETDDGVLASVLNSLHES